MIGYAYAAGDRHGGIRHGVQRIAEDFSIAPGGLERVLQHIETDERSNIVLLQNTSPGGKVGAVALFPSVWSKSYSNFGTPYGVVHRDFHYQCFFIAIAVLVEVGCAQVRIENAMSGFAWRRDAYICLMEAVRNVQKNMNTKVTVHLEPDAYDTRMVELLDRDQPKFRMQEHRPVGVYMHIFEGLNMRTVFVEDAKTALRNAEGKGL